MNTYLKTRGTALKQLFFPMFVTILILMLTACGGASETSKTTKDSGTSETSTSKSAQKPASGKLDKVKVGHVGSVGDAGIYIALEKGYFKEEGIEIETVQFDTGSKEIAPLSTGDLDVGGGGVSAGLFNAVNSGVKLRIVADKGSTFKDFGYEAIVVGTKQADTLKRPKDFKNKKIGITGNGIASEAALDKWLRQDGLTIKDVQISEIPLANMGVALSTGAVDAVQMVEPTLAATVDKGLGKVLVRDDEIWPDHMIGCLMYSEAFAEKTDVAERFMVAYLKGIRDYDDAFVEKDETKRNEVIDIMMKYGKVKDRSLYDKMVMAGLSPNGEINIDSMKADQEFFLSSGSQEKSLDLDKIVDTEFAQKAVEKLGRK